MKQVKKCLGILLVVAMCLNMLVMSALAVEDAAEGDYTEQTVAETDVDETTTAGSLEDGTVEEDVSVPADGAVEENAAEDAAEADTVEDGSVEEDAGEDDTAVKENADGNSMLTAVSVAEESEELTEVTFYELNDVSSLADSDELFAAYVNRQFYGSGILLMANYGDSYLSDVDLQIYNQLKDYVAKVADGKETSTEVTVDVKGLGITYDNSTETYSGCDLNAIINVLLVDCPYELYWFDKTAGWGHGCSYYQSGEVTTIYFSFSVSSGYAGDEAYTTDGAKTSAASTAAVNAQNVVSSCSSLSDYDKLVAFKDYICGQVSYNYDAYDSSTNTAYGDPWQLIYVFDEDSSTNVVCEGYAKAFQYLCDLSGLDCYTVSGKMEGGTGAGSHMWNLVELDGYIYLADITLSDAGSVGAYGDVFLVGSVDGTADGYTISIPSYKTEDGGYTTEASVTYEYGETTESMYPETIRKLALCSYNAHTAGEPVIENEVAATATKDGSYDLVVYCTVCGAELSRETVIVEATGSVLYGDVNLDGEVDAYDASLVLQYVAKVVSEDDLDLRAAEVSADGEVDAYDASVILQYVAKIISIFPAEES